VLIGLFPTGPTGRAAEMPSDRWLGELGPLRSAEAQALDVGADVRRPRLRPSPVILSVSEGSLYYPSANSVGSPHRLPHTAAENFPSVAAATEGGSRQAGAAVEG
jgi:hypothetical protein